MESDTHPCLKVILNLLNSVRCPGPAGANLRSFLESKELAAVVGACTGGWVTKSLKLERGALTSKL